MGLSDKQVEIYHKKSIHEIYPEYYIIKTGKFRDRINDRLDEWIYFLKNAEIKPSFSAKGLKEANEKLDTMRLPEKERKAYDKYLEHLMSIASRNHSIEIDAKEIIRKAQEEKGIEFVLRLHNKGINPPEISDLTDLPLERILQIIKDQANK